ncbi:cytochrome P450 3A24-like isoform X2 [Tachypleus tridentatus]|uniref:cytochrome P450 3A24-like isoform X2 n=1 Tax=Tachypleus tridentatus TaxID=6853 RepID=UPI003FD2D3D1
MDFLGVLSVPNWLVFIVVFLVTGYLYSIRNYGYWKKRGVKEVREKFPFWNIYCVLTQVNRVFEGSKPVLIVAEPELIKLITVKDFHVFSDRRVFEMGDPILDKMLNIQTGEEWRQTRSLISPTFSSGKMKKMAFLVKNTIHSLIQNLEEAADKKEVIDCKSYFGAFTMDTIATCAFGTRVDSHKDPNNPFVKNAREFFNKNLNVKQIFIFMCPKLARILGFQLIPKDNINFFERVTNQLIEYRQKNKEAKNDFLQLLLDAQHAVQENDDETHETSLMNNAHGHEDNIKAPAWKPTICKAWTHDDILANSFLFFLVGYDTTANALSYAAYNLALNPDCQEKLIEEIDRVWEENGGINYEQLGKMVYLDCVVSETLRLFNVVVLTDRVANEDYELGDTGVKISKGTIIQIPLYAIHHDPDYYPQPDVFDPERFLPEKKNERHPYAYIPFGAGPRNCVGMRFALMEAKLCLAYILRTFRFRACAETREKLDFYFGQGLLQAKKVPLQVEKRTDI